MFFFYTRIPNFETQTFEDFLFWQDITFTGISWLFTILSWHPLYPHEDECRGNRIYMPVKLRMENIGLGTDELDPSFCYHAIFFFVFGNFETFCRLFLVLSFFVCTMIPSKSSVPTKAKTGLDLFHINLPSRSLT